MSARFSRIESLYHQARQRPSDERGTFLAEACGSDKDLRREVESLLAEHAATGGFLTDVRSGPPLLALGTRLGVYQIGALIGAGGMGEVYRARDTRLGRDVALKVLPQALACDRDRLARLEREARLLASLNHANIAHVYGLEESNDTRALVMELIDGETLADRIEQGPVPMAEALPIARQIASALAVAHDHGIVHRDLKPANVKVRPDGTVKVLDFGLAKAMDSLVSSGATEEGTILGTAAYMSPEQAAGKPVDRRTDLWAFGAVVMEMLTGRRVFDGDSTAHVLSSVLKAEPDWSTLPTNTPVSIRRLLRRSLVKDPARRLDSAAAARLELDDDSSEAPVPPRSTRAVKAWMSIALVSVMVALVFAGLYLRWREGATSLNETPLTSYTGNQLAATFSPDGTQFAFVWNGGVAGGGGQLYVRPLGAGRRFN